MKQEQLTKYERYSLETHGRVWHKENIKNCVTSINAVYLFLSLLLGLSSCEQQPKSLFNTVSPEDSGVLFSNDLHYTEDYNPYTYRNFYNGGGVALGDINNDGLLDIYFSGNLVDNKLYLNKGNFQFEDISETAGIACSGVWSSGVNMVDINGDGWLDIYVCKAGKPGGPNRHNELFINQGDLTFVEQSSEYGLDITGLSIQSAFFDYDLDGDLDCYLLNNSLRSVGGFDMKEGLRNIPDPEGNKLLENRDGKFVDISQASGIHSSSIGYGLGITLADFNWDGWPDIFLSNDFFEKDYLYFNNQNGTFTEQIDSSMSSLSMGSMGADASDLDNDLRPEIFVTEMLPRAADRKRTKTAYENWDKYQLAVSKGYHHQYPRNVLHKNLDGNQFIELGRLAGVESSDWSWSALMQDYDLDGLRDIFISNGIKTDLLDKDYLNFTANEARVRAMIAADQQVIKELIDAMPSQAVPNAIYRNEGALHFSYQSEAWGLGTPTFSNGSAYGDLDNDGDLDLVTNNVDAPASLYRNTAASQAQSITVNLRYQGKNLQAIGAKVLVISDSLRSFFEYYPTKGFQSSSAVPICIGLGTRAIVDSLIVIWPNGEASVRTQLATGQRYEMDYATGIPGLYTPPQLAHERPALRMAEPDFQVSHQEIGVNLFDRERMLLSMPGRQGPAIATADLNGDGQDDIFVGGGKNQKSTLLLSGSNGYQQQQIFANEQPSEVTAAAFFDSDQDGDLDLYVAHGGKAFSSYAPELHDALYINDGVANFQRLETAFDFPYPLSTGAIAVVDLDKDGKMDIVIGEAFKTNAYGLPGNCLIVHNEGNNRFTVKQPEIAKELGLITGLEAVDINDDSWPDLVMVGEYMPLTILYSEEGNFENPAQKQSYPELTGLWNEIIAADLDGDNDKDLVLGNLGENNFFRDELTVFVHDFDGNGTREQFACELRNGQYYPIHDIDEMYSQMPVLKKKYRTYGAFAQAPLEELVPASALQEALRLQLRERRSMIVWNEGGSLQPEPLPREVQYSTVDAILATDANMDGITDLVFGGNDFKCKPQFGRQDATTGWVCYGTQQEGKPEFTTCRPLGVQGQIRALNIINENNIIVGVNDEKTSVYEWN